MLLMIFCRTLFSMICKNVCVNIIKIREMFAKIMSVDNFQSLLILKYKSYPNIVVLNNEQN